MLSVILEPAIAKGCLLFFLLIILSPAFTRNERTLFFSSSPNKSANDSANPYSVIKFKNPVNCSVLDS